MRLLDPPEVTRGWGRPEKVSGQALVVALTPVIKAPGDKKINQKELPECLLEFPGVLAGFYL